MGHEVTRIVWAGAHNVGETIAKPMIGYADEADEAD